MPGRALPPCFWVSLGVVIAGAITVLVKAPKAGHGPAKPAEPSSGPPSNSGSGAGSSTAGAPAH